MQVLPIQLYRVFQLALSIVPLALFAGIFRYRLFSVDKLVTRTLVYGALAGFVYDRVRRGCRWCRRHHPRFW